MEEVYVIARHNFHHFRATQEKFAPLKIVNDSTVFIRPTHSYLNKTVNFKWLTDAQCQLPNSPPILGARLKHKRQSLRIAGSNPLGKYEKLK